MPKVVFGQCDAGQIGGTVFQDFNYDGINNDNGLGIANIRVFAYSASGQVDSTDTDASGNYSFANLIDGNKYRIEFHPKSPLNNIQSSFFGTGSGSTVQFVTAPNCSTHQGFAFPTDYCQTLPLVTAPCYVNGDPLGGGTSANVPGLVAVPYNATAPNQAENIDINTMASYGANWGVAFQRETQILFSSAVLRRHSGFGPAGPGGLYRYSMTNPSLPTALSNIDLTTLGIPVGTDPRISEPLPADLLTPNYDANAFPIVAKMSLGDLEISEDGKYLYVMNLFNRTLYRIFIDNPFVMPDAADVTAYPLSNPGCGDDGDWRPWAIKSYRGEVYVGMVCTAESTQNFNDLRAYVKKLNAAGGFDPVYDFPLTYTKGRTIFNVAVDSWKPWTEDWNLIIANGEGNYPQPILSNIEFDIDGSMILGFADRSAMQGGYENYGPGAAWTGNNKVLSGGDILRVCNTASGWKLEGEAGGCTTAGGMGNNQGPNGSEYYWGETFENSFVRAVPFLAHLETALGGLAVVPGKGEVITSVFDPLDYNSGGFSRLSNSTGDIVSAYEIYPDIVGYAGKSSGLGDVEALCDPAPLEKGNYVWKDEDMDGIQDPNESPMAGVNVSLVTETNGNCSTVATVQTNSKGEYYFNNTTLSPLTLNSNSTYYIVVGGMGQFSTSDLLLFDSLNLTLANIGTGNNPNLNDSDGLLTGGPTCLLNQPHTLAITGGSGSVDHTCDFGFFVKPCDIEIISFSTSNESCEGASNGTLTTLVTSTETIEYQLNGGAFGPIGSFSNLGPGNYVFTARLVNDHDCAVDSNFRILPGERLLPPVAPATIYEICQNEQVPAGEGLSVTCAACPTGLTGSITWYNSASSTALLGTGVPFNPLTNGGVNNSMPGDYTFYAQCNCGACTSPRTPVVFRINPLPQPVISGKAFPCANSTEAYQTPFHTGSTYAWSITGGGTIVPQSVPNVIKVNWTGPEGSNWVLTVTETDAKGCVNTATFAICIRTTVLVCNDEVNVSVQEMCNATITPEMILEGIYKTYEGMTVSISALTPGLTISGNTVTGKGMAIVTVKEPCSNNTCWGKIILEDKLPPVINCQLMSFACSYTDTSAVIPNLSTMPTFAVIGGGIGGVVINDNCGLASITYSDEYIDVNCTDYFGVVSAKIIRHWVASDMSGNQNTCDQEIRFLRQPLSNLIFPNDINLDCSVADASPSRAGVPTIAGAPAYPSTFTCEFNVTYNDVILPICGNSYKILRTWKAIDWCQPTNQSNPNIPVNPRTHLQVIKVLDNAGPVFACPANVEISTDAAACTSTYNLPDVIATDNCSIISSGKAFYNNQTLNATLGSVPNNNLWVRDTLVVFGTVSNLEIGTHEIYYVVSDDCGNTASCSFSVKVSDFVAPFAACTEITNVGLGSDGTALVSANAFNAGSYDNCGPVYFKVRRMDASTCDDNLNFKDKVKFCCADLTSNNINVILRVYDEQPQAGNVSQEYLEGRFNDCMVQVMVEDKLKPTCQPPANVTVACESFDPSLWAYGNAVTTDNCQTDTTYQTVDYTDFEQNCRRGTIKRTFHAVDVFGNETKCTQRVVVNYNTSFQIKFPDDITNNQCNTSGNFGEPVITGKDCELTAVSFTDQVFQLVPDACYKVQRTWTVIDWCNYDANAAPTVLQNPAASDLGATATANNNNRGHFQYTQIIKVVDTLAPIVQNCPSSTVDYPDYSANDPALYNNATYWDAAHSSHDLCEGPAALSITATDACSGNNITGSYSISLDLNNDGVFDQLLVSGQANTPLLSSSTDGNNRIFSINPNFQFPYGTHKVKWVIRDGCGNETACNYTFRIFDAKKPTVVCVNGLSVNIMQNGMITLNSNSLLQYAEDNCTPANQLEIGVRKSGTGTGFPLLPDGQTQSSVTFDCDLRFTQTVEVWARDKAGNSDFCEMFVVVQDNMNNCSNTNNTQANVAGALMTEEIEGIQQANVKINGTSGTLPVPSIFTNSDGQYNFNALPLGANYTITPEKDQNWLNGVTTYDLILITKHLTSLKPLDSPYKIIAADANRSGTVTTFDIVQLRKLILGIIDSIPGNDSWRFVSKNHIFNQPDNPFATPFPESITVADMQNNVTSCDFVGVKVGDVNNNATANLNGIAEERRNNGTLTFNIEELKIVEGDEFVVKFNSDELSKVLGYQFTLIFNPEELECFDITPGGIPDLTTDNFGTSRISEGILTCSWNSAYVGIGTKEMFKLHLRAKKSGRLSQMIGLSNILTQSEAYNRSGNLLDVQLKFNGKTTSIVEGIGVELYQNVPNPFSETTSIGFYLPEPMKVKFTIMDASGVVVETIRGEYAKGNHTLFLDKSKLKGSGVFQYRLDTPKGSKTQKMVLTN